MSYYQETSGQYNFWDANLGYAGFFHIGKEGGTSMSGAVRFTNVTIPKGTTIESAQLSVSADEQKGSGSQIKVRVYGFDEDNVGEFTSNPMGRTETTALKNVQDTIPTVGNFLNIDVKDIVQEIVNRNGWSSGNAMAFYIYNNGSDTDRLIVDFRDVGNNSRLSIVISSPSSTMSASPSSTPSPSSSFSVSPSITPSVSVSPSPFPTPFKGKLKIAKPGINVLTNSDVHKLIFSSDYGTLKYYTKQVIETSFDAGDGNISCAGSYTHNLGYHPFTEVFVRTYTGNTPSGDYEYCPFFGSGATVAYGANYIITTTQIKVYGMISGVSGDIWHFDFLVFIFKNDLHL